MQRRLIAAVFVVLLAFAQQAALAHGIWHVWQAAHSGQIDHTAGKLPGCNFDAVYGEVLGASGTAAAGSVPPCTAAGAELPLFDGAPASVNPLSPRSRGPPALP